MIQKQIYISAKKVGITHQNNQNIVAFRLLDCEKHLLNVVVDLLIVLVRYFIATASTRRNR